MALDQVSGYLVGEDTAIAESGRRNSTLRRVLLAVNLNPSEKFGSLEEQSYLIASGASQSGGLVLPVFVRDMDEAHRARYRDAGLSVEAVDCTVFRVQSLVRLLRIIDHYEIQLVHWNLYPPINLYVAFLRVLRPQVKHLVTDHNSRPRAFERKIDPWWKRHIKRAFASRYAVVYAVSDYVRNDLEHQQIWKAPRRYHHFVNTDRFRPNPETRDAMRRAMNCQGSFVVLLVAHLIPYKGVHVAIQALSQLPAETVLWIVGEGGERVALEEQARSLGVAHRLSFLGIRDDVSRYMQAADCFVCPSLWQEAAGLVILEAMASGLPVIASAVGGIPEFVVHERTGYLFPAGDHGLLAEYVEKLRSDAVRAREMSELSRAQALARFSHITRVAEALSHYALPPQDLVEPTRCSHGI